MIPAVAILLVAFAAVCAWRAIRDQDESEGDKSRPDPVAEPEWIMHEPSLDDRSVP